MFGDFDDPESEVSKLQKQREGKPLMPELGYNPVNTYLPPREPIERPQGGKVLGKVKQIVNRIIHR